jgi:hypothetical protein
MAILRKVTTKIYLAGALRENAPVTLDKINSDLSLSRIWETTITDTGGDFNNDFNVDFNGEKPMEIYLEDEGIYLITFVGNNGNKDQQYIIYNIDSISKCAVETAHYTLTEKCGDNFFKKTAIFMAYDLIVRSTLDQFLNSDVFPYSPTGVHQVTLQRLLLYIESLYTYCDTCEDIRCGCR